MVQRNSAQTKSYLTQTTKAIQHKLNSKRKIQNVGWGMRPPVTQREMCNCLND